MSSHEHSHDQDRLKGSFLTSPTGLVLLGFLIIAGRVLFTEHRAHVLGLLIWLPLFACFFMHLFMHGKHGGHAERGQQDRERSKP